MSPIGQSRAKNTNSIPDNLYTVILAIAFGIVLATAIFVAYKCNAQYETLFTIP